MEKQKELNLKILYLTNHQSLSEQFNDYLSNLLLHGLREHFGRNVGASGEFPWENLDQDRISSLQQG